MQTKFINLFGAPGVGKSTVAAGVYSTLSARGFEVELVPEFAKELVWEKNASALTNQAYVTARQFYMIHRLDGKCKWVITDSPAFLGAVYCTQDYPESYIDTLYWYHTQTDSGFNYLLSRPDSLNFKQKGRVHSQLESDMLQNRIESLCDRYNIELIRYANEQAIHHIVRDIMEEEQREDEMSGVDLEECFELGGAYD